MTRNPRFALFVALLVFACTAAPAAAQPAEQPAVQSAPAAAAQPAEQTLGPGQAPVSITAIPRFDIKDLYGRIVSAQDLDGWIVLYCFGNEDTAELGISWLKKLTLDHFNAQGILYVIVADTSKYHKALFPMVKKKAKSAYEENLANYTKELEEKGYNYDFKLEDRYVMTLDTAAKVFDLFRIKDRGIPHIFMLDGAHTVRGHFTEYNQDAAKLLGDIIAERDAKKLAEQYQLSMQVRKRQMWKRYAIIGGAAWLLLK